MKPLAVNASSIYFFVMTHERNVNLIGALALALADIVEKSLAGDAPEPGAAAAALLLIHHRPGFLTERLHGVIGLSQPGTVRLVDRLVRDGLVLRKPGEVDRRTVELHLTEEGLRRTTAMARKRSSALAQTLAVLSNREMTDLARIAEKLLHSLPVDERHAYEICRYCHEACCTHCPVDAGTPLRDPHSALV